MLYFQRSFNVLFINCWFLQYFFANFLLLSVYPSVSGGGGGGGGYASLPWGKRVWLLLFKCRLLLTKTDWTCPTNQMTEFLPNEMTESSIHQPIRSQKKKRTNQKTEYKKKKPINSIYLFLVWKDKFIQTKTIPTLKLVEICKDIRNNPLYIHLGKVCYRKWRDRKWRKSHDRKWR